jgi:hypothetical protein
MHASSLNRRALGATFQSSDFLLAFSNNADRPALMNQMTLPNGRKLYMFIVASRKNKSTFFCA